MPAWMDRRTVILGVAAGVSSMVAGPAFTIDIPKVTIGLLDMAVPTHDVASRIVTTPDGRIYRLFTAYPKAPAPAAGFPILYLLDGNNAFAKLSPDLLAAVPGLAVAAIGYDTDKAFEVNARSLDYTPPLVGETGPVPDPQRGERQVGGAGLFAERLVGPLRAMVEGERRIDPARRSLWGHSYGGLFTLYSLYMRPDAFARFIPTSPSLWFGQCRIFTLEKEAIAPREGKKVLVLFGDMERRSGQPRLTAPQPSADTLALIERLGQRQDLAVDYHILRGAEHGPAFSLSLPFALAFAAA